MTYRLKETLSFMQNIDNHSFESRPLTPMKDSVLSLFSFVRSKYLPKQRNIQTNKTTTKFLRKQK